MRTLFADRHGNSVSTEPSARRMGNILPSVELWRFNLHLVDCMFCLNSARALKVEELHTTLHTRLEILEKKFASKCFLLLQYTSKKAESMVNCNTKSWLGVVWNTIFAHYCLRCVPVEEQKMAELERCKHDIQDIRDHLLKAQSKSLEHKRCR